MPTDYENKRPKNREIMALAGYLLMPDGSLKTVNVLRELLDAIAGGGGGGGATDYELSEIIFKDTNLNTYVVRKVEAVDGVETVQFFDLANNLLNPQPNTGVLEPVAIDHNADTLSNIFTEIESQNTAGSGLAWSKTIVAAGVGHLITGAVAFNVVISNSATDFQTGSSIAALSTVVLDDGLVPRSKSQDVLPNYQVLPDLAVKAVGGNMLVEVLS